MNEMYRVGFVVALLSGCLTPQSVECPGGIVCPFGSRCGVPTGCIRDGDCGDGVTNGDELCDDGNIASGDGCSANCRSLETCGNTIIDDAAGEECDDGNTASHDGCSSRCKPETLTWTKLPDGPAARVYPGAAWDAARGRVVIQGGQIPSTPYFADTWYERNGTWTQGADGPAISRHAITNDGRGTVVAYGGELSTETCGSSNCRSCNVLGDDGWTACTFATPPTTGRHLHAMTTAADGSIVLIGGLPATNGGPFPYSLKQGAWSIHSSGNPTPPRYQAAMAFNPVTQQSYLFGGGGGSLETWRWNGTAWQTEYTALPRIGTRVVYEPRRKLMVAWGGTDTLGTTYPLEVAEWDGVLGWTTKLVPGAPAGRSHHAMVYDAILQAIVVFGGTTASGPLGDAWMLRLDDGGPDDACDGTDLDSDGVLGCADDDCWARCTPFCIPGAPCDAAAPRCGDGVCNAFLETAALCPTDC